MKIAVDIFVLPVMQKFYISNASNIFRLQVMHALVEYILMW